MLLLFPVSTLLRREVNEANSDFGNSPERVLLALFSSLLFESSVEPYLGKMGAQGSKPDHEASPTGDDHTFFANRESPVNASRVVYTAGYPCRPETDCSH